MLSTTIGDSPTLRTACERFLDELEAWVETCVADLADAAPFDGHDQGTFTTSWAPLIQARGRGDALHFMLALRDKTCAHFAGTGRWKHGYWTMADVHHGTEHFELFLGTLWRLKPGDGETTRQLVDAAEHMGNWVDGIPPWFDWDKGLFRSFHFGTEGVEAQSGQSHNRPVHLRCANICLLAWWVTAEPRYLDLSALYAGRWADAILASNELPVALGAEGPLYALGEEAMAAFGRVAGQAPRGRTPVDRAEHFLASGAVETLLELGGLTREARFQQAAERLLDVLASQLSDPDAGAAAGVVRTYRRRTGSTRYDRHVLEAFARLDPFGFGELAIEPEPKRRRRPPGIGKRQDMPNWFEDGEPRRHNPILLALAAELAEDEALATRAVDIARAYFQLARQCYPHGRRHGCSARTVSAIARGHGRDNSAGVVTAVLAPLLRAPELSEEHPPSPSGLG